VYKFTGKQRDAETGYDYFGARYYMPRYGRWGQTEPLYDKYISYTPYQYGLLNPMRLKDADGKIVVPDEYKVYKTLYSYLKNDFEKTVSNDKRIMEAFTKTTGMSENKLKEHLKDGNGPKLEISDLGNYGKWGKILGQWDPNTNTVKIDISLIKKLEESSGDAKKVYTFLITAIIMHEGAHGAAEQNGVQYNSEKNCKEFEETAYGRKVDSYNSAVEAMNDRNEESGKSKRYEKIEGGY
jgi:RHS repeat-associated protein